MSVGTPDNGRDPGWVYSQHPSQPPPERCRCDALNVTIRGVVVCPICDVVVHWPTRGEAT